ncbi:MAG: hypothetical protein HY264_10285 [Chloroflexi bacterium]|nr:hypothetical protein [Chloroflexota bacterium]
MVVARGGHELLDIDDPLEAEFWASSMMGTFYKVDGPLEARLELETRLWPAAIAAAEARGDIGGRAILEAVAAVGDRAVRLLARAATARLETAGVPAPRWASELGSAVFESAWVLQDVFGDHEAYFATFRYPGREPHVVNALFDKALGGIIKDAFVGYPMEDPRQGIAHEDGVLSSDAAPEPMARRIIDAIELGDTYLDNDWTPEFRQFRALALARMRQLPASVPQEPPPPPDDAARAAITAEFLASGSGRGQDEADLIVSYCIDYLCDYLGEDPFRWSPIVVEQFLLDYLPRKAALSLATIAQLPTVLRGWVRFALSRRGLAERWIVETEEAVDEFAPAFRRAITDADQFGPAKRITNQMLADGVDLTDPAAIQRWIDLYNARPFEDRLP